MQLVLQQGRLLILKRVVVAAVTPTLLIILVILVWVSRCHETSHNGQPDTHSEVSLLLPIL